MAHVVRLGVMTDIQYGSKPDCVPKNGKKTRHYSKVLSKTAAAVSHLNSEKVDAALHLGDIIDGNVDLTSTRADLHAVLKELASLHTPVSHVLGNHCLDAGFAYLTDALHLSSPFYIRDFEQWRIVVLDTVDVCVARDEPMCSIAREYLRVHQGEPNANDWNGGVGDDQKAWLCNVLAEARDLSLSVIVCGHLPIHCDATTEHILWHSDDIHRIFINYGVKAYFSGHFHDGGYVFKDGIHYVTFESILDSSDNTGAAAVVTLFPREIIINGFGDVTSRTLELL